MINRAIEASRPPDSGNGSYEPIASLWGQLTLLTPIASFPEILNAAMDALELTGRELAAFVGVDPSTVSNWRAGRRMPSAPKVAVLAAVLASPDLVSSYLAARRAA